MTRYTHDHDHEPHEIEAIGHTEPDIYLPGDDSLTWLGLLGGIAMGLSFWACIIGLIIWICGGIF